MQLGKGLWNNAISDVLDEIQRYFTYCEYQFSGPVRQSVHCECLWSYSNFVTKWLWLRYSTRWFHLDPVHRSRSALIVEDHRRKLLLTLADTHTGPIMCVALYNSPSVAGRSRCGRQTTHAIILSNTPSYNAAYTCIHTDTTMRLIYLRPTCWRCRNLTAENNASHASRTTNDRVTTATTHARTHAVTGTVFINYF